MLHRPGPRDKPFRDEADWAENGHLRRQDDYVEKTLGGGYSNGHQDGGAVKERLLSFHVDDSLAGPAAGTSSGPPPESESSSTASGLGGILSPRDKRALALLVALYLLQGIPVGLAFGSIPFLLRAKLSYSQIGIFTLCTYPYSLKLLWSPIVDSIFSPKLGRRKSWIIPIQTIVGIMFWWLGSNVQQMMEVVSLSLSVACSVHLRAHTLTPPCLCTGRARRPSPDRALFHPRLFRGDSRYVFLDFNAPLTTKLTKIIPTDIAVDGQSGFSFPTRTFLTRGMLTVFRVSRLGTHAPLEREPLVRFNRANRRPQHRILSLLHRVPRVQLGRVQVRNGAAFSLCSALGN